MTATKTASSGSIYNKVSVAYLYGIGGSTATRSYCSSFPCPSVFRNQSTASSAEGVIFSVTFRQSGRVVYPWLSYLCIGTKGEKA